MRKIFALLVMSALSSSAFSMDEPEDWDEKKPEKKERRDPSIPPSPHPTPYPSLQPTPYSYEGDRFLSSSPPLSSSSMPREKKERKGYEDHYSSPYYQVGESSRGGRGFEEGDVFNPDLENILANLEIDSQITSNYRAMNLTSQFISDLRRVLVTEREDEMSLMSRGRKSYFPDVSDIRDGLIGTDANGAKSFISRLRSRLNKQHDPDEVNAWIAGVVAPIYQEHLQGLVEEEGSSS